MFCFPSITKNEAFGLSLPVLLLLVVYSAGAAVLSCRYADATLFYDYRKYLLLSGAYSVGNIVFSLILIARLCSAQEAGIYTMAFHVFTIGSVAAQSLENVWYPWSFEKFKAAETMDQGKTDVAGTNDGQERNAAQWRIQAGKIRTV